MVDISSRVIAVINITKIVGTTNNKTIELVTS